MLGGKRKVSYSTISKNSASLNQAAAGEKVKYASLGVSLWLYNGSAA